MYLIAHKYCGQPAFDVATRMDCPLCAPLSDGLGIGCDECDGLGYWWILNDGHRAWPWASISIIDLQTYSGGPVHIHLAPDQQTLASARDTYPEPKAEKREPAISAQMLLSKLGLGRKIERRI